MKRPESSASSVGTLSSRERLHRLGTTPRILPSILSADFAALAAHLRQVEDAGAEVLHLDVMDGHFVPNITFGPPLVRSLRKHSRAFFDTHLMITDPLRYLEPFARAGSDLCTVHAELPVEPAALAAEAQRLGIGLGVALRPSSELDPLVERWLDHADLVLVMSVEPGFGGQAFQPVAVERLRRTRELAERHGRKPILEVDGGIDASTAPQVLEAGAQWLVAGSAVFGQPDAAVAFRELAAIAS